MDPSSQHRRNTDPPPAGARGRPRPRGAPTRADVASAIRDRIVSGDLVPGQRLVEIEMCALLGIGRSAVRAALVQLAEEGVVELRARCNARVRVVAAEEAAAIAGQRLAIERLCIGRAAERIGDADIRRLRALAAELVACAAVADAEGFAEVTARIRDLLLRIADLPDVAGMLARLRARSVGYRVRPCYRMHRTRTAAPTWLAIVDAICLRDRQAAEAAVERHTRQVQASMRALDGESRHPLACHPW